MSPINLNEQNFLSQSLAPCSHLPNSTGTSAALPRPFCR